MIAASMLFLLTVSIIVALAALAAEDALRSMRVATRWIWIVAMTAPPVLLIGPAMAPDGPNGVVGNGPVPVVELTGLVVTPVTSGLPAWSGVALGVTWAVLALGMLLFLTRGQAILALERRNWAASRVEGCDVFVSADRGPAVAGLLRPWIVLPSWALKLPESELRLVILHEEEHLHARDSLLLAAGLLMVVATPWNPVTWWQFRRLRTAMEIDCDRRVLRRSPDRARYGNSLLSVAARAAGHPLGLAAFTERSHALKTRIRTMTWKSSRWTPARAGLLLLVASLAGLQACGTDSPIVVDAATMEQIELPPPQASTDVRAAPTFTPFTVAPSITNRGDVVAAMTREYPPLLRDAGIGGTVKVFFYVNAEGIVEQVRIDESSGHQALDDAALNVAGAYRFSPALNGEEAVGVWVLFPITFQVS